MSHFRVIFLQALFLRVSGECCFSLRRLETVVHVICERKSYVTWRLSHSLIYV